MLSTRACVLWFFTFGVRIKLMHVQVEENMSARVDLEELAFSAMDYGLAPGHKVTCLNVWLVAIIFGIRIAFLSFWL
jgi:hypothetical protein